MPSQLSNEPIKHIAVISYSLIVSDIVLLLLVIRDLAYLLPCRFFSIDRWVVVKLATIP